MISSRLVQLIESHGDSIVQRTVAQLRRDPGMSHDDPLLEYELRDLGECLTNQLDNWLSTGSSNEMANRCARLGKLCCDQQIPLDEAFRGLCMLREKMLDFAQEHLLSNSSMELYAEEELDRRLVRLFDRLAIQLVRGFEQAIRKPVQTRVAVH